MKLKRTIMSIMLTILIVSIIGNYNFYKQQQNTKKNIIKQKKETNQKIDSLQKTIKEFKKDQNEEIKEIRNKIKEIEIKKIENKFNVYNPQINNKFAKLFFKVVDFYNLKGRESTNYLISQVIVESRAKQYYYKTKHPIRGGSGEVGMCQIMPSTAYYMFKKVISKKEKKQMIKLGAEDFSNIENIRETIHWLSNKKNNIILWGFIMNYNMERYNNLTKSLVAYNKGFEGLRRLMRTGIKPKDHWYFKRIEKIENTIEKKNI